MPRKLRIVVLIICMLWVGLSAPLQAQTFEEKLTTESNIALTISNLGIIGNALNGSYILGQPSCRFPRNSDIEHLFNGGLWVGGIRRGERIVTTGAFESSRGYSVGGANYEFVVPFGNRMRERSSLIAKQELYDPRAVSHQDFLAEFTDTAFRGLVPGTQFPIPGYNPLGLKVQMETYNWNFPYSNFFVILNFKIINVGTDSIQLPYIGYWADGVVRNVRVSPPGTSGYFNFGGNGFLDSLYTTYEFDAGGDTAFTRSYFALKFLGSSDKRGFRYPLPLAADRELNRDFNCFFNTWQFRGVGDLESPSNDSRRYERLSTGNNQLPNWEEFRRQIAQPFNRSNLISVGPFTTMLPGDTIDIAFAVILADRVNDGFPPSAITPTQLSRLASACQYVQSAYNGNDRNYDGRADSVGAPLERFLLPSPPAIPNTKVVARDNAIDIFWNKEAEESVDRITGQRDFEGYRIYKTRFGFDVENLVNEANAFEVLAQFDRRGNNLFFNTGFDRIRLAEPVVIDGDSMFYKYTIENLQNGWQHIVALEVFDGGNPVTNLPSLATGPLNNQYRVFPGKTPNRDMKAKEPFVYPNPYYVDAAWEGRATTRPEDKRIIFANLPKRCVIRILTPAGDLIDELKFDENYNGSDIRFFANAEQNIFSGGERSWDLLSQNSQIIARGLYLFTVEDLETGKVFKGNFAVIK